MTQRYGGFILSNVDSPSLSEKESRAAYAAYLRNPKNQVETGRADQTHSIDESAAESWVIPTGTRILQFNNSKAKARWTESGCRAKAAIAEVGWESLSKKLAPQGMRLEIESLVFDPMSQTQLLRDRRGFLNVSAVLIRSYRVAGLEGLEGLPYLKRIFLDPEKTPRRDLSVLSRLAVSQLEIGIKDAREGDTLGQCHSLEDLTLRHWKESDLSGRLAYPSSKPSACNRWRNTKSQWIQL